MKIEGAVALVTGASRGIGRAISTALLDRGAAKVYAAVRDVTTVPTSRSWSTTPVSDARPHR